MARKTKKPFALGILVGRFQTIHAGHEMMINTAAALCDRVGIFVGSSQESGTNKNPFTYELRKDMLKTLFGDKVKVYPLPDIGVGNNSAWGDYVLGNVESNFGRLPDILISGKEARRVDWFDSVDGVSIAELYIPKTINVSATEMRKCFINDDREAWQRFTNPLLWDRYGELREIVLSSKDNLETKSI